VDRFEGKTPTNENDGEQDLSVIMRLPATIPGRPEAGSGDCGGRDGA
jgi:hypothetical protein